MRVCGTPLTKTQPVSVWSGTDNRAKNKPLLMEETLFRRGKVLKAEETRSEEETEGVGSTHSTEEAG